MLLVGLTGGIGAGKSAVATRLAELGAVLIDADVLAREVVAPGTDGLAAVVAAFGAAVRAADGGLDRAALGARVFGDDAARRTLEGIIHPRVRARGAALAAAAPAGAVVVNDVPLLVETGQAPAYHLVVVVQAGQGVRVDRLVRDRAMTRDAALARIAAQASDADRRAAADVLLRNDGTLDALHAAVDRLWHDRLLPYEHFVRTAVPAPGSAPARARLAEPDASWPAQGARLIARIRHPLHQAPGVDPAAVDAAHVGPTSVPGLPARDVLDVQLGVPDMAVADAIATALAAAGLPRWPGEWVDSARVRAAWPERLHGSADPGRPATVHVRVTGSPPWRRALLVRDHARADPAAREAWADAERWAATDPGTGGVAGERWFAAQEAAAEAWAARAGWCPVPD
jgi:dephospho-CoA kinase